MVSNEASFYGLRHRKKNDYEIRKKRPRRRSIFAFIVVISLVLSAFALGSVVLDNSSQETPVPAHIEGQTIIPGIALIYQHKDTAMLCTAVPPCAPGPHLWNDASGPDLTYGTPDDEPHCSAYCAPAAIAMISKAYGVAPPFSNTDDIYDGGKIWGELATGDGIISTHGVGMYDGQGVFPPEVQGAFIFALAPVGIGFIQHDWIIPNPLTAAQLETYILNSTPVLWLDHGGFPANQSSTYPDDQVNEGHAKVIAGYNDSSTADTSDDIVLIYDPWPEYNDKFILPVNATKGPGGTFDPYWIPLNDVNLSDITDIFLVPSIGIPEFSSLIVPIIGLMLIAVIAMRMRDRRESED